MPKCGMEVAMRIAYTKAARTGVVTSRPHLTTTAFGKKGLVMAAAQSIPILPPLPTIADADVREIPFATGYCVDSHGTVWSCRRPGPATGFGQWRMLRPAKDGDGYLQVTLMISGKSRAWKIHRLVLTVFVGPCPNGMVACHYPSNDKSNNSLANLMWGSPSENESHKAIHGTLVVGDKNNMAKLSESDVKAIRARRVAGERSVDLAHEYRVTPEQISNIIRRVQWKHI